ncbi:response regulator [Nocardia sp. BMG111209]|uniref:response regulator n=1 Tax=Nocardia sp. BMG111209 TaxID=1160137 RepID=UPI000365A395|nr:response regulator [Nocardia sp. BMG111209]
MRVLGEPIDILLVEDDAGDELMVREALEENGLGNTLYVVRDGQEALEFLYRDGAHAAAPRPALILLDLNLPKYDGRQVLDRIKSDPDLSSIPVVVLTTSAAEEDILSSYRRHANAYVTKPTDLVSYLSTIKSIDDFYVQTSRLPS